jgi:hypothetical protein
MLLCRVPRRDKINLEKIRASLFTLCTECGYKIPPGRGKANQFRSDALPEVRNSLLAMERDGVEMTSNNPPVEVNDEVFVSGQAGRFVVLEIKGGTGILQLFADSKETGRRIYFQRTIEVPVSALKVIGKNHKRPSNHIVSP